MPTKMCIAICLAFGLLCATASTGSAAVTFGSTTGVEAIGDIPESCKTTSAGVPKTCTVLNLSIGDGGGVAPGGVLAPSNGVITRWRANMSPVGPVTSMTVTPRVLSRTLPNKLNALRSGILHPVPGPGGVLEFADRLTVSAGDYFGLDITTVSSGGTAGPYMESSVNPVPARYFDVTPPLADGASITLGTVLGSSYEKLQINADVEPDADGDGYGDETQDLCVARADVHTACPPPLVTEPKLAKNAFSFTSDIPGKATTTLFKTTVGRKVGKKCKKGKPKKGKSCKIYTKFAQWNDDVVAGANTISYAYKVGGKTLKKGSYRATIVVTSAQNTVTTKTIDFKIKK
jgi:hypothetical protein